MAKYLGIDVGSSHVRAVLMRTSYRRIAIEAMTEYDRQAAPTLEEVVRMVASPLISPGESVAVNLEGEKTFLRRIDVPSAAQKQLTEVLPYELESELPFDGRHLLSASQEALFPEERRLRQPRGAASRARHRRRFLGHFHRS